MLEPVHAVFRDGAFYPSDPCSLPNDSRVTLIVQPVLTPPLEANPKERERTLSDLIAEFERRAMPPDAPRFTRDELHERR